MAEAWRSHLAGLPQEPWSLHSDFPRDLEKWRETLGVVVPVREAALEGVPLTHDVGQAAEGRREASGVLAALCAALGGHDSGREALWVLDAEQLPGAGLPLKVALRGSLRELRDSVASERQRVHRLCQDAGASAAAALEALGQAPVFGAQRANRLCQLALVSEQRPELPGGFPPDFCLLWRESESLLLYRSDLYRESTAHAIAGHAAALLRLPEAWSEVPVERSPGRSIEPEERERLLHGLQGPTVAFPDCCIHHLFEHQARGVRGESVAVIPFDSSEQPWSYAQLDLAAGQVSRALLLAGVEPQGHVPILLRRSCLLVAAIFGTVRAGQAYTPLDPDWPAERHRVVIEDLRADALVLGESPEAPEGCLPLPLVRLSPCPRGAFLDCPITVQAHPVPGGRLLDLPEEVTAADVTPDMSVYILYTSGTTGRPKGCDIPHRGLVGRTQWLQNTWPLGPDDVVAQKTPATFAISEWELFWPLCMGAKMVLAADGLHGDAQHVVDLFSLHKVSHSVFVPSLLDQLLDELNGRDLPDLKLIIACGEALKAGTAVACLKGLPGTELVNLYGPTEASMTMLRLPPSPTVEALYRCPLGLPIENTTVLVGSEKGAELSPLLAQGEIFFGGAFLCKGYWQQPEITKEKFVPNPHGPGELYCTGDLGRWRADGCLEFLGRADSQVKFNGVRIELAEIEGALASLPGVKQAAAFLAPPFHLVAACTLLATAGDVLGGPPNEADRSKLLEGLRTALPKDRVPTRLEVLPTFPLTDRGKVDRKKLLADFQAREAERMATRTVSPPALELGSERSPVEFKVEQLMRDVLGVLEPLPMSTSFQDLGFSSLLLGQLTTRLRRTFALPALPAIAVYKHPTGTSLSDCIEQMLAEQVDSCTEDSELLVPACPIWQGHSPTSALSWACTVLGLFLDCVVSEFAFLPAYYLFFEVYFRFGLWFLCVAAAPIIFLDLLLSMLVVASLKWLVVGRRREATFPVFSWEYWKWRLMHCIEAYAEQHFSTLLTDTPLYNVFLRLQGATIGHGVRINFGHLSEVDLITIGAGSRLERDAKLNCARLWNGQLHLRPIHIGQGCLISHRGHVVAGTSLPPNTELTPMSSSDHFGPHSVRPRGQSMEPRSDDKVLHFLQLTVGIPLLLLVDALSHLPVFITLEWLWKILSKRLSMSSREARKFVRKVRGRWGWGWISGHKAGYTLEDKQRVLVPFVLLIPWVMTFIHGGAYFLLVVLLKKFFIGEFREGHQTSSWDRFRHWLMERLATSVTFSHFMELWVNTEVLSACYRMLGANVARRVNMDFFAAVEYDLLTIETDVVFGSAVLLANTAGGFSRSITLRRGACVLDHSCVMPGAVVPEGALLGSFTVVPSGQSLEAMTVYMGNEQGKCVKLFQRPLLPGEQIEGERVVVRDVGTGNGRAQTPPLPPVAARQRALEAQALMHHWSSTFYVFNAWCALSAVLFAPLTDMVYWATIIIDFEVYDYFGNSDLGELAAVLLIPVLYLLVTFGMLLVLCTLKWLLIGRWKAGDRPYYSWFHFRWAALMVAFSSLDDLMESIAGTYLAVLFMRAMGASVGERVCFFGHGFEYDLLHIGDEVCIGPDCDVTCHTVENMVMRMQTVRFERGSSCLAGAVAMPGAMLEQGSTLIEHSQVLKGETVPQGSYFGGLPAKLLRGYKSLSGRSPPQELPARQQQQHRRSPVPGRQSSGAGLLPLLAENNPSILVEMSTLTPVSDVSPCGNNVAYSTLGEHPYL